MCFILKGIVVLFDFLQDIQFVRQHYVGQ